MEINSLGTVMGRIDQIRGRWGAAATTPTGAGATASAGSSQGMSGASIDGATISSGSDGSTAVAGFDPFGDVYQQALLDAQRSGAGMGARTASMGRSWGTSTEQFVNNGVGGINGVNGINGINGINGLGGVNGTSGTGATGGALNPYGHQVGGYGTLRPPAELAVYGNGQVPRSALTSIGQGGHVLYAPAAASFVAMRAAAARDGLQLTITDSYRSYDQQVELANRKGLSKNGGWAAVPGTSNHGWGLAVDANVNDPKMFAWLQQHGAEYGWVQAAAREPWHWEFRPDQAA